MCSWCRRVRLDAARWVEVEDAVAELRLFEDVRPPQISHGVCPICVPLLWGGQPDAE
jgi:hypothetical protein